jgi:Tfp pilus assembly protein PilO
MKQPDLRGITDFFKKVDPRYLYLIPGAAVVFFFLADYFLLMAPELKMLGTFHKNIGQIERNITDLKAQKLRLKVLKDDLAAKQARSADFNRMVHKKDELPLVLKTISALANEYGVQIDQLLPQKGAPVFLLRNKDGGYSSLTIFVSARSGYHAFGRFIDRLETDKVFLGIDDFSMTADPKDPKKHEIKMQIKVLILEK